MYYDPGFDDWVYEIDEVTGKDISNGVMKIDADSYAEVYFRFLFGEHKTALLV